MNKFISYEDFEKVNIRLGTIIKAHESVKLRKPSIILEIDFGEKIGVKKSSAQLQKHYDPSKIIGKQVAAVINFEPKQIGNIMSEVLVLGFPDDDGDPVLISPDIKLSNGGKLF